MRSVAGSARAATFLAAASACGDGDVQPDAADPCASAPLVGVVASDTRGEVGIPALAAMPGGNAVACGTHLDIDNNDLTMTWCRAASATGGPLWAEATDVSSPESWAWFGPLVEPFGADRAFVLWADDRNGDLDSFVTALDTVAGQILWELPVTQTIGRNDTLDDAAATEHGVWIAEGFDDVARADGFDRFHLRFLTRDGELEPGPPVEVQERTRNLFRRGMLGRSGDDVLLGWVDIPGAIGNADPYSQPTVTSVARFARDGTMKWRREFGGTAGSREVLLADDGTDGAWVVQFAQPAPCNPWICGCPVSASLHVQHLQADGTAMWPGDGPLVVQAPQVWGIDGFPMDDGSLVIAWHEVTPYPSGECRLDVKARRVTTAGELPPAWDVGTVLRRNDYLVAGDSQGLFFATLEYSRRVSARRLRPDGGVVWEADVAGNCPPTGRWLLTLAPDGGGGLWLSWYGRSPRPVPLYGVFAHVLQHLDAEGSPTLFEEP